MKALKIILLVVLAIVVVFAVIVFMQPSHGHVEKSIVINAPASQVFEEINSFKSFNAWSPWAKMDPNAKYTFEGPESGVGAKMKWDGEKVGKGSQWIEESVENQHVKNGLNFGDEDGKFYSDMNLQSESEDTKVTWSYDGANEGFAGKAMWVFMKGMLEKQYEQGLGDLKKYVESKPETSEPAASDTTRKVMD